ncbi:MAG: ribbon-helix-helix protein, CopG family [Anaerovoracaceae bacterium]
MKQAEKERLTKIAEEHGLSLSAFFRLAADEYIKNHDW